MKKKTWLKKGLFALAVLLICAGLLIGPSILAGGAEPEFEEIEALIHTVRTQAALQQTLVAHLDINGDIVSAQQVDVFPEVGGRLAVVRATLGDFVNQGDVIAEIDPSRPGAVFMNSAVHAPISGVISRTPLSVGMTVGVGTSITLISVNENLEINARVPEREIAGLAPGLRAQVSLQAHPGETLGATVTRVSPVVDAVSRTKLINLSFDQRDPRVSPGMFARLRISTRSYNNVISVPAEAIVSNTNGASVFVVSQDDDGQLVALRRQVETGVTLQGWTEIRTGIETGEEVIVQGQHLLSGGEHIRIIGQIAGGVQ
ncbi:MAG: efflux RND transporter periplasmic adaptor subunit [Spirochaetes bacterium]|nr:efflux RND transporter periplasmic adaptor subunit [Spirochaetota bacterium]